MIRYGLLVILLIASCTSHKVGEVETLIKKESKEFDTIVLDFKKFRGPREAKIFRLELSKKQANQFLDSFKVEYNDPKLIVSIRSIKPYRMSFNRGNSSLVSLKFNRNSFGWVYYDTMRRSDFRLTKESASKLRQFFKNKGVTEEYLKSLP